MDTIFKTTYYKEEEKIWLFVTRLICVVGMSIYNINTNPNTPKLIHIHTYIHVHIRRMQMMNRLNLGKIDFDIFN